MIEKPLSQVDAQDVRDLAVRQVTERRTLDYKRDLDFRNRDARKEFVADILSFANAGGGDIIFGVDEARDAQGGKLGYPEPPVGTALWAADDEVKRAIEQCVRDSSEPRVPSLDVAIIDGGFPSGRVVIVRVPRSTAGPHRSLLDNAFYSRATTGKYQLDVRQLRGIFVDAAKQEELVRAFVSERVRPHVAIGGFEGLLGHPAPVSISDFGARIVVHVVASSFGDRTQTIDVRSFPPEDLFPSPGQSFYWARRHNLDGVVVWERPGGSAGDSAGGYWQVFRKGAIECVDAYTPSAWAESGILRGDAVEDSILKRVSHSVQILAAGGAAFPFFVFASVLSVHGRSLRTATEPRRALRDLKIDREIITLPDIAIYSPDAAIDRELRFTFDALWQAGGWPASPTYGADGSRTAQDPRT